jgi:hypothetical protein
VGIYFMQDEVKDMETAKHGVGWNWEKYIP